MKRILVAEDEQTIHEFAVINPKRTGYEVTEAENEDQALELYERENGTSDVAILDIMMPGQHDGLVVCRELRQKNGSISIILLTAKTQEIDKVSGLIMGADDYMTKPSSLSELMVRADAVYRRVALVGMCTGNNFREEVRSGIFPLNLHNRTLMKESVPIELTQVGFQIMEYFFSNPGKALGRSDILRHVWGDVYHGEEKIMDVNIRRLRMKIEDEPPSPKHIVTVWGLGYKWEA